MQIWKFYALVDVYYECMSCNWLLMGIPSSKMHVEIALYMKKMWVSHRDILDPR